MLQCSGGCEPCSATETFQPLSPLSGAIHPTEYSPRGQGEERRARGPRLEQEEWREGVGGAGVNLSPLTWSVGHAGPRTEEQVWLYGYMACISVGGV